MARVAVVVPAYNAAQFIAPALDSVRAQTHRDFETVVIDDGSEDDTGRVVRTYPEVQLLVQANAGVAASRNRGVRATRSDWLAFLDADDLWTPEKLTLQIRCAEEAGAGAVFCDLRIIDREGLEIPQPNPCPVSLEMEPLLLHSESIPQGTSSTILIRRAVFESIGGYDETLATMADWDLLIRVRKVATFAHVPLKLTSYRRYPGTMSRSVTLLERESLFILDKTFGDEDLRAEWRVLENKSRAWNDLVLSGSHFAAGNWARSVWFGGRAIARDPQLAVRVAGTPWRRARNAMVPTR